MKHMTRVEMIQRIAADTGAGRRVVAAVLTALFDLLHEQMLREGELFFPRLGVLRSVLLRFEERKVGDHTYTHRLTFVWKPTQKLRERMRARHIQPKRNQP